jgi:Protein of unknown function (DUF2911)
MKNIIFIICLFLPILIFAQINLPALSPSATVSQQVALADISIQYSRPALRGRKIMGSSLVPYGKVWRTGANKIPRITVSKDVVIEGHPVAAGSYGIITIPNMTSWTIIFSSNADQFGTFEYKESEDKFKFTVPSHKLIAKEEYFTMGFTDFNEASASIFIKWENVLVKFKISQNPHEEILAEIKQKTSAAEVKSDTYYSAAEYYYDKNIDLTQALEWADKVIAVDKQYWNYNLRGKIEAKLGKCDMAIKDAKEGLSLAKNGNDPAYIIYLNDILKTCKAK